jgi:hypothetical protein
MPKEKAPYLNSSICGIGAHNTSLSVVVLPDLVTQCRVNTVDMSPMAVLQSITTDRNTDRNMNMLSASIELALLRTSIHPR